MQGLVDFTTDIADGIAVTLPAFCYIAACVCFFFAVWTMRQLAVHHHHHPHWQRPWVPFVSLILCGVFASFDHFLGMTQVSIGSAEIASLTDYAPTTPPDATGVMGATPSATVINVVTLFSYFFQMFGAACVFWAIMTWRAIVNGRVNGSSVACGVQLLFGAMLINIVAVANGVLRFFTAGG